MSFSVHTRRQFFQQGGVSLAPLAWAALDSETSADPLPSGLLPNSPLPPRKPHFTPRARSVIFLHMIGGPSQIDLLDPKPQLLRHSGKPLPESIQQQLTFAQIQEKQPTVMASPWRFSKHGLCGADVSELLPHTASIVDSLSIVRSVKTDDTNHMFAELMLNTGWRRFGRPSIGSWIVYGLGSISQQLPAFMALRSGMRPRSKSANYGHGFLPAKYQATPLRSTGAPILNLANPPGFTRTRQRQSVDTINALNRLRLEQTGDDEIAARIVSYEMAFRMQSAATEWLDLNSETSSTLQAYGLDDSTQPSYARNCLLARRLVERGVRFVHLFHGDWDHHSNIAGGLPAQCRATDQPTAALIRDLAQRGLLNDTLVIWGGELGRGPVAQKSDRPEVPVGRDHQIEAFTMWFAGGGVKPGQTIGETNAFGCLPVSEPWHIYDIQATLLHLLGLDHTRLTHRHQGRDFRLTDIHGKVKHQLFS
ncbi:MAG: DUF1501 domain-containing protein [Planctomycetaceae bacterium]